jgi:hypothetical protein
MLNHFDFQSWLESINLYAKYCSAASSRIWMPAPPTTRWSLALGWGFTQKNFRNSTQWGLIPKDASQKWTKTET